MLASLTLLLPYLSPFLSLLALLLLLKILLLSPSTYTSLALNTDHFLPIFLLSLLPTPSSSLSLPIITLSIKLATFPVLIRFHRISFIMVWNIAGEFVSPKNITVGLNNPSSVINTAFYSSPFFILILLYPYCKSIFINIFFVPMFSTISEIRGNG